MNLKEASRWFDDLWGSLQGAALIIQEKGFHLFAKPLGISAFLVFVSYFMTYRPSGARVARVRSEVAAAEASARYASDYDELKNQLSGYTGRLVPMAQKDNWLFNKILSVAREEEIVLDSIGAQQEQESDQFFVLKVGVTAQIPYYRLGQWVARIESSKTVMRVEGLNVTKLDSPPGFNRVSLDITSFVPKLKL